MMCYLINTFRCVLVEELTMYCINIANNQTAATVIIAVTGPLAQLCHVVWLVVPQLPPVKYDWNCSLMAWKVWESRVCCYPASMRVPTPSALQNRFFLQLSAFENPPSVYRDAGQATVLSSVYTFQPFLKSRQLFLKKRMPGPLKTCISGPQSFGFSRHKLSRSSKGLSLS